MENIEEILGKVEGLTDEAKKTILDGVKENYRTIAEINQKADKIATLEKANGELSESVKKLEADGGANADEIKALQEKVAAYEKQAADEAADKADKEARAKFGEEFAKSLGEKKFANSVVQKAVTEAAYQLRKNNADMGIDEIIKQAAPDEEGVWANPQRDPKKMPQGNQQAGGISSINTIEDVKNMTPEEINKNWDAVKKLLAKQ